MSRFEVVTVGVVLVLLTGLLMAATAKTNEESNLEKCQANLRAIGVALGSYAYKNNDLMPQTETFNLKGWDAPAPHPALVTWSEALVADGDLVQVTNRNNQTNKNDSAHYAACGYGYFDCPSSVPEMVDGHRVDSRIGRGYGLAWCASSDFGWGPSLVRRMNVPVKRNTLVPAHIIAADGWLLLARTACFSSPAHQPKFQKYGVYERHLVDGVAGANYLFADGHVEWSDTYGNIPSPVRYGADASRAVPPIWVHP